MIARDDPATLSSSKGSQRAEMTIRILAIKQVIYGAVPFHQLETGADFQRESPYIVPIHT